LPKWREIAQNNLHVKFAALGLNVNFDSSSIDTVNTRRTAHVDVNESYHEIEGET